MWYVLRQDVVTINVYKDKMDIDTFKTILFDAYRELCNQEYQRFSRVVGVFKIYDVWKQIRSRCKLTWKEFQRLLVELPFTDRITYQISYGRSMGAGVYLVKFPEKDHLGCSYCYKTMSIRWIKG